MAGAVILDVTCFAEAERLYMLARDTAVHGRPLTALVLPDVLVSRWDSDASVLPQDHVLIARGLIHATMVYLTTSQMGQDQFTSEVRVRACPRFLNK